MLKYLHLVESQTRLGTNGNKPA